MEKSLLDSLEAQVSEVEKVVLGCSRLSFNKVVATTELDRASGFLSSRGFSWFMNQKKSAHEGIWILGGDSNIKTFFRSYDRETCWVLNL